MDALHNDGRCVVVVDNLELAETGDIVKASEQREDDSQHDSAAPTRDVQRFIRHLSNQWVQQSVMHDEQAKVHADQRLLRSVMLEVGDVVHDVAAVEVYVFEDPRLVPVEFCWMEITEGSDDEERDKLTRPEIAIPGIDLVGALWQHAGETSGGMKRVSSLHSLGGGRSWSASFRKNQNDGTQKTTLQQLSPSSLGGGVSLHWRELDSVIHDPDVLHGPRLEALKKTGLQTAAGVGFEAHGTQGMVVYYSRAGPDSNKVSAVVNEIYLCRTASLIGNIQAATEARRASAAFQWQQSTSDSTNNKKEKSGDRMSSNGKLSDTYTSGRMRNRMVAWYRKLGGSGTQIPPGMPLVEALWTVFGVVVGLLTVSSLNELFQCVSQDEYFLIMGPFGALVTLQYGLTGAPAAQPRNIVWGHVVAGAISLVFTYIPETVLPLFVRQLLAPAVSIGAMVKLGITHPPAGAFSVIFAQGEHNWGFYALAILGSIISILPATIVNNLNQKRQYPTYWGFCRSHA